MANGETPKKKKDKTKSSITAGIIMMGIGVVFLLSNLNIIPDLDEMWPLILIIVGAAVLFGALRDKKAAENGVPITPSEPAPPPPLG